MKKRKWAKILTCLLTVTLIATNSTIAFAGTSGTPGSVSGHGGGSGGSSNSDEKIGPSYSRGLRWAYHKGNVDWSTHVKGADRFGGNHFTANSYKWACVQKHSHRSGWFNFRWQWYFNRCHMPNPGQTVRWSYYTHIWQSADGRLQDAELAREASKGGYWYSNYYQLYKTNSDQKLDIVWLSGWTESKTDTKTTIVYATEDGNPIMKDRSSESARTLYESPTNSVPYSGKSKPNEMHHKKRIEADYVTVTKKTTYKTDGNKKWDEKVSYSKGGKTHDARDIIYDVVQPTVDQSYFKPFNLNRNGLATDEEVRASYPGYNGGIPLKMSVDNNQNITDGKPLHTLDTNTSLPFSIKFENGQFGIPTSSEGGFDLADSTPGASYKNSDGSYSNGVIGSIGSNGSTTTGRLWSGGMRTQNINGNISKDSYWAGSMKANLSADTASLTYDNTEKVGGDAFSFNKGWMGGNFLFKTTKMGTYRLTNDGRNWWEMQYEKGKFYGYGVSYGGTINVGHIGEPSIKETNLYAGLASRNLTQPVVMGTFDAKTVAGDLG